MTLLTSALRSSSRWANGRAFSMTPWIGRRDSSSMSVRSVAAEASGPMAPRSDPGPGEAGDQLLQLVDAGVELRALLVDGAQHRVQVGDHIADELIARGEGLGERAGAGQHARQRPALALQQLDDGVADLVDLVAVQALEHRAQTAEQRVQVQGGLCSSW